MIAGKLMGPVLWLGDATWFKWASSRNKYETIVNLLNEIRKNYVAVFTCEYHDLEFYTCVAKHGVIRRVGRLSDLLESGDAPFFQTRKKS